ncbi:hypothetical protein EV183_000838 [Coemansia sp. RSA 2336]|nr:hypothetical protein EV183_000838 [Coemansia sp. RSA 2336]
MSQGSSFFNLPPAQRIHVLKDIISSLSPYERCIAKRELLLDDGNCTFDLISCLPADIAYLAFGYLSPLGLNECLQVSRQWRVYAQSATVISLVLKNSSLLYSTPSPSTNAQQLRLLTQREQRWMSDRPRGFKAIPIYENISELVISGHLLAVSYGRNLRVWRMGKEAQMLLSVRENSAKSLAICPSGEYVAYLGYLRCMCVYAVNSASREFVRRTFVDTVDQVDICHDLIALRHRNQMVEVVRWKQNQRVARIQDTEEIFNSELVYETKLGPLVGSYPSDRKHRLKAMFTGHVISIFLYGLFACVAFSIDTRNMQCGNFKLEQHEALDAWFTRKLVLKQEARSHILLHANGQQVKLNFPGDFIRTLQGSSSNDLLFAINDDMAAIGCNKQGISLLSFSQ